MVTPDLLHALAGVQGGPKNQFGATARSRWGDDGECDLGQSVPFFCSSLKISAMNLSLPSLDATFEPAAASSAESEEKAAELGPHSSEEVSEGSGVTDWRGAYYLEKWKEGR